MYNISLDGFHPSTICVELSNLQPSLQEASELLLSEYPEETVKDFIEKFARTTEIMPDDRTVGFIIINKKSRMISISVAKIPEGTRQAIMQIFSKYKEAGINTEIDIE
ncbi:Thermoplasma acidophilum protein [Thermoplasmatales archaeon]|nr:Thermoplasma acidophilum protein [Thermoplasmatales archaeon]